MSDEREEPLALRQHEAMSTPIATESGIHIPLFEPIWVKAFCERWNCDLMANQLLAAVGPVRFELTGAHRMVSTTLSWDGKGKVSAWIGSVENIPCFSGPTEAWAKLISGERTAVASVLRKALIYRGPIVFAVRNGQKFDRVANVARDLARPLFIMGEAK